MGLARLVRARQRAAIDLAPGKDVRFADFNPFGLLSGSGKSSDSVGPAPMYGGNAAQSAGDWNTYTNEANAQATAAAPTANYGAANTTLGQAQGEIGNADTAMGAEGNAMALDQSAAEGNQPSAAQIQMGQGVSAGLRAQLAGAASARGGAYADAAAEQAASAANEQATAGAVGNSAELRAQEMANARTAYSSAAQGMQSGDIAASGAEGNIASAQQQQGLSQAQLQAQQNALNVQGSLGYNQLAQNIDTANLSAATANQATAAGQQEQNAGFGMQVLGAVTGAAGDVAGLAGAATGKPAGADIDLGGGHAKKFADADGGGAVSAPSPDGAPLTGVAPAMPAVPQYQSTPQVAVGGGSAPAGVPFQAYAGPAGATANGLVGSGGSLGPQSITLPGAHDADNERMNAILAANGQPPQYYVPKKPSEGPPGSSAAPPVPSPGGRGALGTIGGALSNFGDRLSGTKPQTGLTKAEMMALLGHAQQPAVALPLNPPMAGAVKPAVATGQVTPPVPTNVGPAVFPKPQPMSAPPQMPGPMAGAPLQVQDMDLRAFSQGGFGSHGQEPNPGQPDLNAGPPQARGLARFAKRPTVMPSPGGIRAADADFQEPAKVSRPGGLAHWTLREEPNFIAAANQRNHKLKKLVTEDLTPKEEAQVLGPHGAGPIFSDGPDRDRLEMNDMQMGMGPGQASSVVMQGTGMNPMGTLQQFSRDATAYGRNAGSGPAMADGDLSAKKDDYQKGYDEAVKHVTSNTDLMRAMLSSKPPMNVKQTGPDAGFYVRGSDGGYVAQPYSPPPPNLPPPPMPPAAVMMAPAPAPSWNATDTYPAMNPDGGQPMPNPQAIATYPDADLGGYGAVTKKQYADGDLTPPMPVAYPDAYRQALVSGVQVPRFVPMEQAPMLAPPQDIPYVAAQPTTIIQPGSYASAMRGIREPLDFTRIREVPTVDPEADNASVVQVEDKWKPPPPTLRERAASGLAALAQMKKNATRGVAPGSALLAAQREMASVPSQRVASR